MWKSKTVIFEPWCSGIKKWSCAILLSFCGSCQPSERPFFNTLGAPRPSTSKAPIAVGWTPPWLPTWAINNVNINISANWTSESFLKKYDCVCGGPVKLHTSTIKTLEVRQVKCTSNNRISYIRVYLYIYIYAYTVYTHVSAQNAIYLYHDICTLTCRHLLCSWKCQSPTDDWLSLGELSSLLSVILKHLWLDISRSPNGSAGISCVTPGPGIKTDSWQKMDGYPWDTVPSCTFCIIQNGNKQFKTGPMGWTKRQAALSGQILGGCNLFLLYAPESPDHYKPINCWLSIWPWEPTCAKSFPTPPRDWSQTWPCQRHPSLVRNWRKTMETKKGDDGKLWKNDDHNLPFCLAILRHTQFAKHCPKREFNDFRSNMSSGLAWGVLQL